MGYSPSHFSSTSEAGLNVRLLRRPMHLVPADTDENKSTWCPSFVFIFTPILVLIIIIY